MPPFPGSTGVLTPMMPMYTATGSPLPMPLAVPLGYYGTAPMSLPVTTTYTAASAHTQTPSPDQAPHATPSSTPASASWAPAHGGRNNAPGVGVGVGGAPAQLVPARPSALEGLVNFGRAVWRLVDLKLAAKMVMLVVLLNPGDAWRAVFLSSLALVAFLYQTGILAMVLGPWFGRVPVAGEGEDGADDEGENRPDRPDAPPAITPGPGPGPANALAAAGGARGHRFGRLGVLNRKLSEGTIPRTRGLLLDLYILTAAIFLSLFPS
jgi:hypothetical protein